MAAYAIRMPELAAKSKVAGELDVDPGVCTPVFSHDEYI